MQTILVVDDNFANRLAVTAVLESVGYKILTANSGKEAIQIIDDYLPDLVISDILMPIMDGFEFVQCLRLMEGGATIPVIFTSATYLKTEAEILAKQCGVFHILITPTNPDKLKSTVQNALCTKYVPLSSMPETFTQDHIRLLNTTLIQKINALKVECKARKKAEETIRNLAYYDSVTGLPNRTMFVETLQERLLQKDAHDHPLAVVMLRIKQFTMIVNTLGYQNTDRLFLQMGERLQKILEKGDFLARLYNDFFALLLPLRDRKNMNELAASIRHPLERPYDIGSLRCKVDVHVGIALYPGDGEEAELLCQRAHVALQLAGETARGYAIYTTTRDPYSKKKLSLLGDLQLAIETNQLTLVFQPKIEMKSCRVTGVEALVRWQHPVHGNVTPETFIGPAEQTGLINPLTQWVLNAALRQSSILLKAGFLIPIAVNISVQNLTDPDFPHDVEKLLAKWNMEKGKLELEITETAMMTDPAMSLYALHYLKSLGITLSMDDFGTGYSSLGYIKKLPISTIKIDQSFTGDITEKEDAKMIIHSIIGLAHNLGRIVVAEGVETKETWDQLVKDNCDEAQGFFISHPMSGEDLLAWLSGPTWSPNVP